MDDQIKRYTPLVRSIARRYPLPDGWSREDVEQWGMLGLWNALKRYDPDGLHQGRSFPTVATFAIRHAIYAHLPEEMKRRRAEFEREEPDISDQPTIVLAPAPASAVASAWLNSRNTRPLLVVPLEYPDPAPSVEEQVVAAVDGAQISAVLESALLLLPERQRYIVEKRYGLGSSEAPWTFEEIGQALKCNRSTAWRNERKAIEVLRSHLRTSGEGEVVLIRLDEQRRRRQTRKRATAA